jgi:exodeoxyribonuclease VII small subunit
MMRPAPIPDPTHFMSKQSQAEALEELSFEDALARLESIVEEMEDRGLPLESLINHYQTGSDLLKICQHRLRAAQLRIQEINLSAAALDVPEDSGADGEPEQPREVPAGRSARSQRGARPTPEDDPESLF